MNNSELSIRILAIILAVFLWSYVRINVLKQPEVWRTISGVPVILTNNETSNFQYQYPKSINVEIKGPADLLINLPQLTAIIDVTNVKVRCSLPVKIIGLPPGGVQISKQSVEVVPVETISRDFDVNVILVPELPKNVSVNNYIFDPSRKVTAEGPAETINKIKYITAHINPIGNYANFTQEVTPIAIGEDGEQIKEIAISPEMIKIKVSLAKK